MLGDAVSDLPTIRVCPRWAAPGWQPRCL